MKIQIDTDAKTIKIEGQVSVKEFYDKVQKLLPEDWESYKLETNTVIHNWGNVIVRPRPYFWNDFYYSQVGNSADNRNALLSNQSRATTYNIEC